MAVQKNVIKGILAGTFALMLSGCVTVPDAIKGSSPTPQQDLVRVMSAPQLYVGQEARFGGKVVAVQNQQGKTRLEIATVPLDSGARPTLGEPSRPTKRLRSASLFIFIFTVRMQKQRTSRCFFFFKNKQLFSYNCLYSRGAGIIPAPSAVAIGPATTAIKPWINRLRRHNHLLG